GGDVRKVERGRSLGGLEQAKAISGDLRRGGGSQLDDWNNTLANQALSTLWVAHSKEESRDRQYSATVAALIGIGPRDEIEGMIAAQLIAAHNAAMECYRRAMIGEQTFEGRREKPRPSQQALPHLRGAARRAQPAPRQRPQKVGVEHVHVHAGGQAVVGTIETPGGGDRRKSEHQPHAKQIAHAPQPTMWSADKERVAVPVTRDAERPMPHARRKLARRSEGEQERFQARALHGDRKSVV